MSTVSARLAEFVALTRYEDLSPRATHMAKLCLLDAIGVSLGASGLGEGCPAFVTLGAEHSDRAPCTILGFARSASPEGAAFANGALAHALDYEDSHDGALVHPNAPTVPAALAIAEGYGPISGRELLTAIAVGCDVVVRLGLSLKTSLADYGWYPPPLLAAFGATAAAAKLLRLNELQVRDAFSLTLCQATCSGEIIYSPNSVLRAVRDAFPARAGVTSALLAQRGVTGFEQPLEGRAGFFATFARGEYDPAVIVRELGKRFEIENISFKPWPSCRGTHAAIEAALALRSQGLAPEDIAHVQIRGGRMLRMLDEPRDSKRRPATAIDAKFSLPFTTATALTKGRVGLHDFLPAALNDSEVLRLAALIDVDAQAQSAPGAIGASLEVRLQNGGVRRQAVETPLGAPANPMTPEGLVDKFVDCAGIALHPIDAVRARHFVDAVLDLDSLPDAAAPLKLLTAEPVIKTAYNR